MARIYGHTPTSWMKLVQKGQELYKSHEEILWAWADLLAEVAPAENHPPGRNRQHSEYVPMRKIIAAFREEVGIDRSLDTLVEWRHVGIAWPKDKRVEGCGWRAHRIIAGNPARFDILQPGMSARQATARAALADPNPGSQMLIGDIQEIRQTLDWAYRILRRSYIMIRNSGDELSPNERHSLVQRMKTIQLMIDDIERDLRPRARVRDMRSLAS